MDIGTALRTLLIADVDVAASLVARIYPDRLPQAPVYPAMTYQVISDLDEYSHGGNSDLNEARLQYDLYAETYVGVIALRDAVKDALDGYAGNAGSPALIIGGAFWINEIDFDVPETEPAGPTLKRKLLELSVFYSKG